MKPSIIEIPQASCYFHPLMSKYSPQHPVLRHPLRLRDSFRSIQKKTGRTDYSCAIQMAPLRFVLEGFHIFRLQNVRQTILTVGVKEER
jgi:hypothetical protein